MQLQHHNTNLQNFEKEVVLLCDGVNSPANIGSLLRIADSFSVSKVIFGNTTVDLSSPRLKRTARSTQNWIPIQDNISTFEKIEELISQNYIPIALEITDQSIPLDQFNFLNLDKVVLVIGDENTGISESVLRLCAQQVHIKMFGKNSSMNVSQATAITLYELTKQLTNE